MSSMPPMTPPPPPPGGSFTPPPPPPSPGMGGPAGSDRTLMVVLAYLWILAIIPFMTKKDDPEVQWHAKHGLVILGAEVILWILSIIIGQFAPSVVGCGLATAQCIVWIGFLVLRIICIVKGVAGQRFRIPVLSDFADKM